MTVDALLTRLRGALEGRAEVRFALLFGSAATRGPHEARDVGVAVSLAKPMTLLGLAALSNEIEVLLGREVDLVDLDEASTLLRWEVAKHGKVIIAHDRNALLDFQARIPIEHEDLRPTYERESDGLPRALKEMKWSASTSFATKFEG